LVEARRAHPRERRRVNGDGEVAMAESPNNRGVRRGVARRTGVGHAWAAAWLTLFVLAGCARNPVTGRPQLALISEAREIEMGREAAAQVEEMIGLVGDDSLQAYIRHLGATLTTTSERPHLPWRFGVIDDPVPNAFSLPGGFVFITRGLLAYLDAEAELVAVLGHEVAHVNARHAVEALSRAQITSIGLFIGAILFPPVAQYGGWAGLGLDLLFLEYGRDAEYQADDLAAGYALRLGYQPRQIIHVLATLERIEEEEDAESPLPTWLSTHPSSDARVRRIEQRFVALADTLVTGGQPYLVRLDGLVYGDDPRSGFFRDGLFLHPELRFQVEFPQGWERRNLARAVIATSRAEDAILQLTLVNGGRLAAADSFRRDPDLERSATETHVYNGIPAIVVSFSARGDDGTLTGLAAFLDHGGHTYRLLGYSHASAYRSYESTFRRTIASFAPLTDPGVIALRPDRLQLVRLLHEQSLAEFAAQYPSTVPLSRLAILNQVADASARFAAGTLLKRVSGGIRAQPIEGSPSPAGVRSTGAPTQSRH
jgi:predicted Zn-dependent protease